MEEALLAVARDAKVDGASPAMQTFSAELKACASHVESTQPQRQHDHEQADQNPHADGATDNHHLERESARVNSPATVGMKASSEVIAKTLRDTLEHKVKKRRSRRKAPLRARSPIERGDAAFFIVVAEHLSVSGLMLLAETSATMRMLCSASSAVEAAVRIHLRVERRDPMSKRKTVVSEVRTDTHPLHSWSSPAGHVRDVVLFGETEYSRREERLIMTCTDAYRRASGPELWRDRVAWLFANQKKRPSGKRARHAAALMWMLDLKRAVNELQREKANRRLCRGVWVQKPACRYFHSGSVHSSALCHHVMSMEIAEKAQDPFAAQEFRALSLKLIGYQRQDSTNQEHSSAKSSFWSSL